LPAFTTPEPGRLVETFAVYVTDAPTIEGLVPDTTAVVVLAAPTVWVIGEDMADTKKNVEPRYVAVIVCKPAAL
jgi:hypothetical protein